MRDWISQTGTPPGTSAEVYSNLQPQFDFECELRGSRYLRTEEMKLKLKLMGCFLKFAAPLGLTAAKGIVEIGLGTSWPIRSTVTLLCSVICNRDRLQL